MESPTNDNLDDVMDFSDLMDDQVGDGVTAILAQHGLNGLSEEEIAELANEQEAARKAAGEFMELSAIFMDRLDDARTVDDLKGYSESYFNIILPDIMEETGLTPENSNVIRMLKGLEQELSTFWSRSELLTDEFCLKSSKFDDIKRIFANFVMMLGMVKNEGNWEDLERGVHDIIGISGKDDRDIGDLEIALSGSINRSRVAEVLLGMDQDEDAIRDAKLEALAGGNESLHRLTEENSRHKNIMGRASKAVAIDPDIN